MVYALTSKMTEAAYKSCFRVVRRVLPLNYIQLTIITDYERALMTAVKSIFPESKLRGCWFHFCQVMSCEVFMLFLIIIIIIIFI